MFSIFRKKEDKDVFHQPYRPSWEQTARDWERGHYARKKEFEGLKHDLSSNTLPRV